jgi:hypothetical protein
MYHCAQFFEELVRVWNCAGSKYITAQRRGMAIETKVLGAQPTIYPAKTWVEFTAGASPIIFLAQEQVKRRLDRR